MHTDPHWQIWRNNCFNGKNVILTQTQVISTQWTLKRPKKLLKAKFFSKAKKFKFYDFFSDLGWFANNYSEKSLV